MEMVNMVKCIKCKIFKVVRVIKMILKKFGHYLIVRTKTKMSKLTKLTLFVKPIFFSPCSLYLCRVILDHATFEFHENSSVLVVSRC